jgi:hypothetical protein
LAIDFIGDVLHIAAAIINISEDNMSKGPDGVIQIFNADHDPLYVELQGGNAFWLVPRKYKLADVKFLTHLTEDGSCYFENLVTNETSWSLPVVMSEHARNNAITFQHMNRDDTEIALLGAFPEEESEAQMAKIDAFYDPDSDMYGVEPQLEHGDDEDDGDAEEKLDTEEIRLPHPSMIMKRYASTAMEGAEHSSDDDNDAEGALASLNKRGRPSIVNDAPPTSAGPIALRTVESVRSATIKVRRFQVYSCALQVALHLPYHTLDGVPQQTGQEIAPQLEETVLRAAAEPHRLLRERQAQPQDSRGAPRDSRVHRGCRCA